MGIRREQAKAIIYSARADITTEQMRRRGWHQASLVLDEAPAIVEVENQLGDPDYEVEARKTCTGFQVWTRIKKAPG